VRGVLHGGKYEVDRTDISEAAKTTDRRLEVRIGNSDPGNPGWSAKRSAGSGDNIKAGKETEHLRNGGGGRFTARSAQMQGQISTICLMGVRNHQSFEEHSKRQS
jgi:hypothetical protein